MRLNQVKEGCRLIGFEDSDLKALVSLIEKFAESRIISFIDPWTIHDFVAGVKTSCIQNLYVAPKYKMKGVASRLEETMEAAKANRVFEIDVLTEIGNKLSVKLCERQVFLDSIHSSRWRFD